jgi:Transposase DDE domain
MPFAIGNARAAARGEWLMDRIVATGSLVVRKIGMDRAGEMAVHRFLSSPFVSVGSIVETIAARTAEQCAGRRIVAIQDTTEINFKDRSARRRGLGPGANGHDPGFFLHPIIAVDADDEAVIGLLGAQIWTREQDRVGSRRDRPIADKESVRWLNGCATTAELLAEAASVTMIADRESDIYELFTGCPDRLQLIVRAAQDRSLADGGLLFGALAEAPELARRSVRVAPRRPGDAGRMAVVAIRAGCVRIACPKRHKASSSLPRDITLTLVEAIEIDPPNSKEAIVWHLLTTHAAADATAAVAIIDLYRLRWRIEQVFRALKSDGMQLDDTQLANAERLFILAAMGLAAAVRTIQLVDARDGSSRPASDVVDPALMPALQAISKSREGATQRQKNPHPPHSLAFVAWVAARLGGWNCYGKPPGPKTMRDGWRELAAMLFGYAMAKAEAHV